MAAAYWSNELGVSRDELRSAVAKAGPMVKNVREHLQLRDQTLPWREPADPPP
jgi:hypothetical protein